MQLTLLGNSVNKIVSYGASLYHFTEAGVDVHRLSDGARIAWAALANAACGAVNDNGVYLGTSAAGVYLLSHASVTTGGDRTSDLVQRYTTTSSPSLQSNQVNGMAGRGTALLVTGPVGADYLPSAGTVYRHAVAGGCGAAALGTAKIAYAFNSGGLLLRDFPAGDMDDTGSILGGNLVDNGGFDNTTGWSYCCGWSISGGKAVASSVATAYYMGRVVPASQGLLYRAEYKCTTFSSGTFGFVLKGNAGVLNRNTAGTFVDKITAGSSDTTGIRSGGSLSAQFDDVKVHRFVLDAIKLDVSSSPAILSNSVRDLRFSDAGNLFIASDAGVSIWDGAAVTNITAPLGAVLDVKSLHPTSAATKDSGLLAYGTSDGLGGGRFGVLDLSEV